MELFWILMAVTGVGLMAFGLQIIAVRSYTSPHNSGEGDPLPLLLPPISILKPLKDLDDNLFDNLESFCTQDYPSYEIIFSLQDHNDPAYKVARRIKDKYPQMDISIIVENRNAALNPKVGNLIPAFRASKYEYILISDSNVMADGNYLREIVRHMQDAGVGLVSNLIRGVGGRTIGALFENLHLNSFIIGSVCFLDLFMKMPCVVGKSMLMRKEDLRRIGGLGAVKDILAEDYVIGERIRRAGKRVVLSSHMVKNVNHYWGMGRFLNRHTRWGKLRWKIGGIKYVSELICNPVFMSCMTLFLCGLSPQALSAVVATSLLKILGDSYLGRRTGSELHPLTYLLSPLKDIVIGLVWFIPLLSNTVVWRGNRYIIGKDSVLSPHPGNGILSWRYRIADAIKARLHKEELSCVRGSLKMSARTRGSSLNMWSVHILCAAGVLHMSSAGSI